MILNALYKIDHTSLMNAMMPVMVVIGQVEGKVDINERMGSVGSLGNGGFVVQQRKLHRLGEFAQKMLLGKTRPATFIWDCG